MSYFHCKRCQANWTYEDIWDEEFGCWCKGYPEDWILVDGEIVNWLDEED